MFIIYNEAIEKAMRDDPYIPPPDALTLTATADNSSVMLNKVGELSNTFEVDTGNGWTPYNLGTSITRNRGETVKFRCVNHPTTQSASNYIHFEMSGVFEASGDCNSLLSPNYASIRSLNGYRYAFFKLFLDCGSLTTAPTLPATTLEVSCYSAMFRGCTALVQAPALPATTLESDCYNAMFSGCTALTKAPELPATTLADYCYSNMFAGCTSLTQAPELPATTLEFSCYYYMFDGCKSLTQAPELPATTLAQGCYRGMFQGCTSLTEAPVLPATTLANDCYNGMFKGCTSLTEAPVLPVTTLANDCYSNMFRDCTSLTKAPALPATTLANYCYNHMFRDCTSLTKAPALPATTLTNYCYSVMFYGCSKLKEVRIAATTTAEYALNEWLKNVSATGDFYCDPNATIFPTDSASGIPKGWTRHDINTLKALTLTATADNSSVGLTKNGTLDNTFEVDKGNGWEGYAFGTVIPLNAGESCRWRCKSHPTTQSDQNYVRFVMTGKIEASGNVNSMLSSDFENLTSLSGCNYAFYRLFGSCSSLTQAPQLPATTLAVLCYSFMFDGCTSLTQAPVLPATTLANGCYDSMFKGCTSLTQAPVLPATTLANGCYGIMFYGCTSLTQAPQLPATTLADSCYRLMFNGCSSLTQAPQLPATALAEFCYFNMFSGCSNLNEVRIAATTTASFALNQWLSGVSATGDFYCDPNATIFPPGVSGIPSGWVRRNIADYPTT